MRFDRWSIAGLALILVGLALRVAAALPLHKFPADGDAVLVGLCGLDVLHGKVPVFFQPARIGALECYAVAPFLAVFGTSRLPLVLLTFVEAGATLIVAHRFVRTLFGRRRALIALADLAVAPPAVLFWTYMPNSYPTLLLLCVTVLWLASRLATRGLGLAGTLAFGFVVGLAFWHSFLSLSCSLPAVAWVLFLRRREWLADRRWAWTFAGAALLGAAPWIVFNVWSGFPSFVGFASRPAASVGSAVRNLAYLVRYQLPELVASPDPAPDGLAAPSLLVTALRPAVLAIHLAAAGLLLVAAWRGPRWLGEDGRARAGCVLLLAILAMVLGLNAFSGAGEQRGLTVRYVLPLCIVA